MALCRYTLTGELYDDSQIRGFYEDDIADAGHHPDHQAR